MAQVSRFGRIDTVMGANQAERMVLLVCILKNYRQVEELLLGFLELDITGATVVDARGMGQLLVQEHPLFVGSRDLFPGAAGDSHLILSVTNASRAQAGIALLERIAGPLTRGGSGVAFTVPIGQSAGLAQPLS